MRKAWLPAVLVWTLHSACGSGPPPGTQGLGPGGSGGGGTGGTGGSPLDGAHITVSTVQLDLGWVCIGGSARGTLELENRGSGQGTASLSADLPASVDPGQVPVPPGATAEAAVVVQPMPGETGTLTGAVHVQTRDGKTDVPWTARVASTPRGKPVALCGGTTPCTALQVGQIEVGGETYATMDVGNDGCSPFNVTAMIARHDDKQPAAELSVTDPVVPFSVPAGGTVTVHLAFDPTKVGVQTGNLLIRTDTPSFDEIVLPWSGIGQ